MLLGFALNNIFTYWILASQKLSTRARKDVNIKDIAVQVCVFCFDCLYLNGETLLEKDLGRRRAALYSALEPEKGMLEFATAETSKDIEELQVGLTSCCLDISIRVGSVCEFYCTKAKHSSDHSMP